MTKKQPHPTCTIDLNQDAWEERFAAFEALFRDGQFSDLWANLHTFSEQVLPEERRARYYFFLLSCAVYGIGNLDQANALNRRLDFRFHPTMRYRLCLRQKDYVTAHRLRHAYDYNENEQADFRHTLGLHCLAKCKFKFGFHFYQERYRAINTPKNLMSPLQYHYLTSDPEEDPDTVVLEQGVGEVMISLLHIKNSGKHEKSHFCGMSKYRRMVARYFPQATYHTRLKLSEFEGKYGILALDFLKRSWDAQQSFAVQPLLDTPLRTRHSKPKFGICWRGGSAQNRREERHIPLPFFVEFLPKEYDYIVLQYDITDEEKQLLQAHPNIQTPLLDLTNDALVTFDVIRELAGVIAVAGANWHLAGSANIPFLAIMHDSAHWLWGKHADAKSVYPSATTLNKAELSFAKVDSWAQSALSLWQARPIEAPTPSTQVAERPIFVTGLPGSDLSHVMQQFAAHGIWLHHETAYADQKDKEVYGNPIIRHRLVFNILKHLGVSQDGLTFPPKAERLPPFPWLRFQIEKALSEQGYEGNNIWGYQDFRLALLWPQFAHAYPNATWIIVEQDPQQVGQEMLANPSYAQHSSSLEYWNMYLNAFKDRLSALRHSQETVISLPSNASASAIQAVIDIVKKTSLL